MFFLEKISNINITAPRLKPLPDPFCCENLVPLSLNNNKSNDNNVKSFLQSINVLNNKK
jgi:hypothetical protein